MAMPTLQSSFDEWRSPDFQIFQPIEVWLLGVIALGFSARVGLPAMRIVLVLSLCHMALAHTRFAEVLGVVGPLALAPFVGSAVAGKVRSSAPTLGRGIARWASSRASGASLVLATVLVAALCTPLLARPIERSDDHTTPASALAAAKRLDLSGAVFNGEGFGGYLIFRGLQTFIDGRIELYGDEFLRDYLRAENGGEGAFAELLGRYQISWTLLSPAAGAVGVLDRLPGWRRVYTDNIAVIHMRVGSSSDAGSIR
jgi:hypothetical protein